VAGFFLGWVLGPAQVGPAPKSTDTMAHIACLPWTTSTLLADRAQGEKVSKTQETNKVRENEWRGRTGEKVRVVS
jgi:hypothetical protein